MDLIPGLPNDIAVECLIRVPYIHFSTISLVCHSWNLQVKLPDFWQRRKAAKISQTLLIGVQARVGSIMAHRVVKFPGPPVYRLTVCDPETDKWSELPPVPGYESGLPMFCRITAVGSKLVLIGGCDPTTWEVLKSVFVYDFVADTWRRGSDMPGPGRSFFGCASDLHRMVVVAGGHDNEKNALKSVFLYDVEGDDWTPLASMKKECDECSVIFHNGKFHVIGGYCTETQGRFEKSGEVFDPITMQGEPGQEDFLVSTLCPRTCINGGDGKFYLCHEGNIMILENFVWRVASQLPIDMQISTLLMAWQSNLVVTGSSRFGECHSIMYMFDLKEHTWRKIGAPMKYIGYIQSSCLLEV